MIDPNANEAFRRIERPVLRERGQLFFSPPGSGLPPKRRPDLGEALEYPEEGLVAAPAHNPELGSVTALASGIRGGSSLLTAVAAQEPGD